MNELIDDLLGVFFLVGGQVGVAGSGQNGAMTKDFLYGKQIDAGFQQMRGVAVAQTVGRELFFIPQSVATCLKAFCTPPRSSGEAARAASCKPPWRLGKSRRG